MVIAAIILVILSLTVIAVGYYFSGPAYKGPVSDHFDGRKFFTPNGRSANGFGSVLKWMIKRKRSPWPNEGRTSFGDRPPEKVSRNARITFINHSTFLIQVDGLNILTDPVWSERVSPLSFAGPKRKRRPGIKFESLPKIDVILLSHNHYDHLDLPTMKRLYEKHHPNILTSLGISMFLKRNGISGAIDLDWWQKSPLTENVSVQCVPAQHFSGRGLFDRDATLWSGFVICRHDGNIYFAGDTGYHATLFKEIGRKCSPIELAIIPIGAYKPEWFMSPIHCSPEEALRIHVEVGASQSIACHLGTFALADDGRDEPFIELQRNLKKQSLPATEFIRLPEGEGREFVFRLSKV